MSDNDSELITDSVMAAALTADKGADVKVSSWAFGTIAWESAGVTANVRQLAVKYRTQDEQEFEVSYVVKIKESRGEAHDDLFHVIHEKESTFYSEVVPALNAVLRDAGHGAVSVPKNLYECTERGRELIILENLHVQGYEMKDKTTGIDSPHTMLVLKELAKLHAAWMLLQEKTRDEELVTKFTCLKKSWTKEFNVGRNYGAYLSENLDTAIAMFEKMGGCENAVKWIKKIKPNVWEMHDEQMKRKKPFAAIVHGDAWINNFLYKYDESGIPIDVKLLDFQFCENASVAIDLQHLFNMNLTDAVRRPNLDSFLKYYYHTFAHVMEDGGSKAPFTLEELTEEYRARGFYGVLYSIMWLPNVVRRPEDDEDDPTQGSSIPEREKVLRMVDRNPLLKPRIMSIIEEWTECGLISL